ncbi:MAG: ShlB/FhaC/HecB family hemolysin secretion/activation protein [Bradyrhizobium sp.]|nr:ShlB/FhaC/HecB family hemolysin secretion/activation protein [Bradyrhizobium sp.]
MQRWTVSLAIGAVLLTASAVRAQSPVPQVNPGLIESDIERQRQRIEQQQQVPRQQGPAVVGPGRAPAVVIPGGGPRFLLRRVEFDPSKFITPEELRQIAAKYVGKQIDIAGLQNLVAEINQIYAQRGIVTAIATLPPQTAANGVVRIRLTEGRLQRTTIQGNQQTSASYIQQQVNPPAGEVLDVPQLTTDVTRFNRTNEVQIRALLQPGTDFGLTDLQLAVTEPPRNTLQIFADNQGVQTTGRNQVGLYYKLHGLAGIDDRLTFYGVKSEGNLNGNVAYNIPFNPWGGRIGVSYTQGDIRIVSGPFQPLDVTGKSNQTSVNIAQPFFVNQAWLVQATGAYAYGNSSSDFASVGVTDGRYSKSTGGLSINLAGETYGLTFSPGYNSINWHDKILGGERSFNTATGSLNGYLRLPEQFYAVGLASYQYTPAELLPGDQLFSVGGPTTVRGYPTNIAAGDSGYYFNAELHRDMSDLLKGLDVFVFIDSGAVFSTAPARTQLDSSGVGVSWTPFPSVTLEASVGFPWRQVVANQSRQEFYGRISFRPLALLNVR